MKNLCLYIVGLFILLAVVSCSKNKAKVICPPVPLTVPVQTVKFQVVDKTSGQDLFFSQNPPYALTDIKIVFRNSSNKLDSISPPLKEELPTGSHFVYAVSNPRTPDTCYIKIKSLKTDTMISTFATTTTACSTTSFLNKVQVNKNAPVAYASGNVIVIKK
ncbi:hypothetical protein [Mucilaginibacter lappiensis]|uniref:Lipoprotein n=1 Tax=Mucilaginibacter lappiensis TaxID=354630 RepID=A0A841JE22_9SPHI|nr:hypothetical protein [Mucilaginibacter lappiensis]MBB6129080.1 hypothetical protein [Mucilaginibacter lappiensis]